MANLNKTATVTRAVKTKAEQTVNYHGAVAFKLGAKQRLIEHVLGSFWNEDMFYQKGAKTANDIIKDINEVAKTDPKFILQLAAYARNEIYLRTAPQVLLVQAANIEGCKPFVREYAPKIIKRADELSEVVAYQLATFGKAKFPNSLKKGINDAFANFDEYQINKYDSDKKDVKLGDVAKLTHPKLGKGLYEYITKDIVDADALPKTAALKALLAKDSLDDEARELITVSNATWETLISKFGSSKQTWELVAPNMGYMALLRNLRNFIDKGVDLDKILAKITNPEQVARSKQLPFRFYSAYQNVRENQKVERAIAQAFEHSISNVKLDGSTAVLVDLSGSMSMGKVSEKSDVTYDQISAILGAIAVKKAEESIVIKFGQTALTQKVNPDDTMMTNIAKIRQNDGVGHATNAWLAFKELGNRKVDRVILLSDMQCYDNTGWTGNVKTEWEKYRKANPKARLYSFNLAAYGTSQLPSTDGSVTQLNGWSDKVLDYINLLEKKDVMASEISKY